MSLKATDFIWLNPDRKGENHEEDRRTNFM